MNIVHFSSKTDEWETPQETFDKLNEEFNFTLDVCATEENAKCSRFFSKKEDGLSKDWSKYRCWMNPPYGRDIEHWIRKAFGEMLNGALVVCLLPARTDTRWFHNYCSHGEIRFIKGRLKFGGAKYNAPFPSMIVIFRPSGSD